MTALFRRLCRVIVGQGSGAVVVEGIRATFKVKKSLAKEPNELDCSLFNLASETRKHLQAKGTPIIIEAGYDTTSGVIFSGQSRFIDHKHEGPDWETKIQCADGELAYRWSTVNGSFKAGTPVSVVFDSLAKSTGLDVSEAAATFKAAISELYTQGYVLHGRTVNELDRLLRGRGFEWSVQNGKLQVLPTGGATPTTAVVLSAETGLIGSPEHGTPETQKTNIGIVKKPQYLRVKSLLQSRLQPGGRVLLDALESKGLFKIDTVTHVGDTHGGDWYSECECVPITG